MKYCYWCSLLRNMPLDFPFSVNSYAHFCRSLQQIQWADIEKKDEWHDWAPCWQLNCSWWCRLSGRLKIGLNCISEEKFKESGRWVVWHPEVSLPSLTISVEAVSSCSCLTSCRAWVDSGRWNPSLSSVIPKDPLAEVSSFVHMRKPWNKQLTKFEAATGPSRKGSRSHLRY